MFTGLVQALGSVKSLSRKRSDAVLEIKTDLDISDLASGDSLAVNGACLTVTGRVNQVIAADVSAETLSRTNLRLLTPGSLVNLEKALKVGDFLGGHLVLGHVDAVGTIRERTEKGGSLRLRIEVPADLSRYLVEKGSITVDGVSLTINECTGCRFAVNIIPHTARTTTLEGKKIGEAVNIEADIIGKYVEKLLGGGIAPVGSLNRFFPEIK